MRKGYTTLLSVIVLGAMATLISLLLLDLGLSSNFDAVSWQSELKARSAATACAEMALYKIITPDFESNTKSYTLGNDSSCSYIVQTATNTEIDAVGISGHSTSRIKVVVDQTSPKIHILSWEELADF